MTMPYPTWETAAETLRDMLRTKSVRLQVDREKSDLFQGVVFVYCIRKYLGGEETFKVEQCLPDAFFRPLRFMSFAVPVIDIDDVPNYFEDHFFDEADAFLDDKSILRIYLDYEHNVTANLAKVLKSAMQRNIPLSAFLVKLGVVVYWEVRQQTAHKLFHGSFEVRHGMPLQKLLIPEEITTLQKLVDQVTQAQDAKRINFGQYGFLT